MVLFVLVLVGNYLEVRRKYCILGVFGIICEILFCLVLCRIIYSMILSLGY